MKHIAVIIMSLLMGLNVHAADRFVSFAKGERTAIEITNSNDTIVYDPAGLDRSKDCRQQSPP